MYSYIVGKVVSVYKKSIVIENNYVGYFVLVPKADAFETGKTIRLYLHKYTYLSNKNSLREEFYGFRNWEEKEFFINCLSISGVGPKSAIGFLQNDINVLKQLISNKDTDALEQLPGISKKYAYLLVEYLADFYVKNKAENYDNIADVINVLKTLGYNQDDINFAINRLCETNSIESTMETSDVVAMAIKLISTKNEASIAKA
ncbi:MAG: helix-hairpin-helix domain-containing protein [Mycoplasmoidaceae bacterium]|nr:helix-hairpin-helix domain-containing protein [Mycoplasmoidaceae bacterium]